ncbi:MAG: alpha amylase C-terminal domain-containing protein, partial [Kiritimatiellae bacterium]|nr:alpha amylase C-terminal domain-containing protein [Kiritimatiellia bacterium]
LFLFNFHREQSVSDYPVLVPPASRGYRLVLSTDDARFGGHDRIEPGQTFALSQQMRENELCWIIRVYLPCRTAMVLERIEGVE